jgi:DNA-binding MarR family transcriptional regulator
MAHMPAQLPEDADLSDMLTEVERQFTMMLYRGRAGFRRRAAALHPNLQIFDLKLLGTLNQLGPMPQADLAARLDIDKAAVSRSVKRLTELGFVNREPDPNDGRAYLLRPSAEGAARYQEVSQRDRQVILERLAQWDRGEVRRLADLLAKLNESFD